MTPESCVTLSTATEHVVINNKIMAHAGMTVYPNYQPMPADTPVINNVSTLD